MNIKNIKVDKMRYQKNNSAYRLILLGMAISVHALFSIITPTLVKPSMTTAFEIIVNIMLLLATFLAAEKARAYDKNWGFALFLIAAVHLIRIFFEPRHLLSIQQLTGVQFTIIMVELIVTATLYVIAGIITIRKHQQLMHHLKEIGE